MTERLPKGLFEGVRVLELGQYVAAPYAAELFAHGGADRSQRVGLFEQTKQALSSVFAGLPSDEIVDRLLAHGIPASRFRLLEEVLFDAEAEAGGLLHHWHHPTLGEIRMPAAPVTFSDADYAARSATPALGEHTDDVLRELGYDDDIIDRLVADGVVRRRPH